MLTVASVFWQGKFRGREKLYTPEWVTILRNMVQRNLSLSHEFICLTNVPDKFQEIKTIPLKHDWPGWWSKIELFRPDLYKESERVLYIDIDMLVISSLEEIVNYPAPFVTWPGLPKIGHPKKRFNKERKLIVDGCKSALMAWDVGCGVEEIYDAFNYEEVSALYRGDQDWISNVVPDLITPLPTEWVMKTRPYMSQGKPKSVKVLGGLGGPLGKNEIAAKRHKWIGKIWQ